MATAEDRIKMECDKCGYKCIPQWLNDKAHCLKCQAVLRTRGSCHETKREVFGAEANGEGRREPGLLQEFKHGPASAMESSSGSCSMSPDGAHHWKYGKCNYCQMAEGKLAKGPGVMANPGGAAECDRGGKCIFKFAKCTKCGRSEMGGKAVRRPSHEASVTQQRSSEAKPSPKASPQSSPRPQSPLGTVAATLLQSNSKEDVERTPSKEKEPTAGQRNERTRVVCHVCGYKSVPQWMNDRAHCLKCDAVLKTQATIHGSSAVPENMEKDLGASRACGEVSTYKLAPSSAMESSSGTCSKSPNGMHHWKYGKCNYCQAAEGKLIKGAGALANPGGTSTCSKDGGKCMFKFSKCTKCGRREI
ncbi:unnamed protein product [Symbiodinium necroappetens]|uniref:Uncharacterized protein n=1 Tax=Symbiodinium necroappetens TaxID=1628268 RepID=A0A813A171_9DINO|nr:unnamed protein product [Symbiodinium necroappetens]